MKHEYVIICTEPIYAYFKCHVCNALISLEVPSTYEEAEAVYTSMVKEHSHE